MAKSKIRFLELLEREVSEESVWERGKGEGERVKGSMYNKLHY